MTSAIADQVIDFYSGLFDHIFSRPFQLRINDRLKQKAVLRQVDGAADAASQSLTRYYLNEQLTEQQVARLLSGFAGLTTRIKLDDITNPNIAPETIVETLLQHLPCPASVQQEGQDVIYRLSLHSIMQVLMLVGPVMTEWQKLNFSVTYELPNRIVNNLNQISEQLAALGHAGQTAADGGYELSYRDYLLQRFHRIEAGTVRMTTNLNVDLRELFVTPRLRVRPPTSKGPKTNATEADTLMNLAVAREFFGSFHESRRTSENEKAKPEGTSALQQMKDHSRNIIVGIPGSGKSTFLEWLQLRLASGEEEFVLSGQQAIPLLLRIRQLDPRNLPRGAALVEKATASQDRVTRMPPGWLDRQMAEGRVLLMLDGLDETEPDLRDRYILPWLHDLCREYPHCCYLISSRPVGYPPGALTAAGFVECDLQDFDDAEISEYCRHWCTSVRLARNEPEEEARREGANDGERIVQGFSAHPYIRNLARNPLMLSAICLVNYFEGGELPKDRAVLYRLCVEGLLHHWDQRRGIHSEFTLEEKLRICREVALAMQAEDRAEYEADKVQQVFALVLQDPARAKLLLEHIRYRTGLLLERRPGIFAFAHLTFQEYLAARAIYEGNRLGGDVARLAREHADGRWKEVIALYCGLASTPAAKEMIEQLIAQPDSRELAAVLAEAYLSAGPELSQDTPFRRTVLERIAIAPEDGTCSLVRFAPEEVAPIANSRIGTINSNLSISESHHWLQDHPDQLNLRNIAERTKNWHHLNPFALGELIHLLHAFGSDIELTVLAHDDAMYAAPGPRFANEAHYESQALVALAGLSERSVRSRQESTGLRVSPGLDAALLQILRTLVIEENTIKLWNFNGAEFFTDRSKSQLPLDKTTWPEFASLTRELAKRLRETWQHKPEGTSNRRLDRAIQALTSWADSLEQAIANERSKRAATKTPGKKRTRKVHDGGTRT